MSDEQKLMSYEERVKRWEVHGLLGERQQNIREYINEQMEACRPISPAVK